MKPQDKEEAMSPYKPPSYLWQAIYVLWKSIKRKFKGNRRNNK